MSENYKTYDQAKVAFNKLKISSGDIVVVTVPEDIEPAQMQMFSEEIETLIPEEVTVLCVRSSVTVKTLSKKLLNEAGWYQFDNTTIN